MTQKFGFTQDGKRSERTLNNVGERRFLVVEFDFKPGARDKDGEPAELLKWAKDQGRDVFDVSAALHSHLARLRPLCLVVNSGGKSLHGWYPVLGSSEEEIRAFMSYAVALGADKATFTPIQLVRMPGGTRENGNKQPVVYFAPARINR